jgi:predicted AAA+ superfamily ATPase
MKEKKYNRYLTPYISADLDHRMIFIAGPRQVGKTTFARQVISEIYPQSIYLNWDNTQDRHTMMAAQWPTEGALIVLDELHKYRFWKRWIKGEYDKYKDHHHFVVTGSAKLDTYRKQGDSLFGRYHYYRMHPFTLAEMNSGSGKISVTIESPGQALQFGDADSENLHTLFTFGGFPEPLFKRNARFLRQWHQERSDLIIKGDLRDIATVHDMSSLTLLSQFLPEKVGALLSLNSLREDLGVSYTAVSRWIQLLETVYYCYRIYPYTQRAIRSLKKEPKLYLWDWSQVPDPAARFENMIAGHLLKFCHLLRDYGGYKSELHYLRNVDKREVDFLVTLDGKPWFAVEAKRNAENIGSNIHYFKDRLHIPHVFQVIQKDGVDWTKDGVRTISASRFLTGLV